MGRQAAVPVNEVGRGDPERERSREPVAAGAPDRLSHCVTRASDDLLDFLVLAFAAWTVIYHACLVLRIGAVWAAVAGAIALAPCAWLAIGRPRAEPRALRKRVTASRSPRRKGILTAVNVLGAVLAAGLFAFTPAPWWAVWPLFVLAAGAAVLMPSLRLGGGGPGARAGEMPDDARADGARRRSPATLVALGWALALAGLSLFLVAPDGDDAQYVRLSAWIADHGEFPLRDVIFSNEALPAVIYPPLSSFEALAGTVARETGIAVPDLVYLVVTPMASALSVLAAWRLLRTWSVGMIGISLSVAMVFLLMDAERHRAFGNLFISRMWQGKVIFLAVLVPLLFALLDEYVHRPTRRQLLLLVAAGVAGVGLTSTAAFVIPVIAGASLATCVRRNPGASVTGFLASVAYPLAGLAVTLAVGRRAAEYTGADVAAGDLVPLVLADGVIAFLAVTAALVGPSLIRRASTARMAAATVLLVGVLFAPGLSDLVFDLTGIGRVLWRLTWAVPVALLVGVLATALGDRARAPGARVLPAVVMVAALVVAGTPLWSKAAGTTLAAEPAWKRPPESIEAARRILEHAEPGDTILAPSGVSQTILVMSGTVATVAPRAFYTEALQGVPGAHARERLALRRFAEAGLGGVRRPSRRSLDPAEITRALRLLGVDIACVPAGEPRARALLREAGYSAATGSGGVACLALEHPAGTG